MCLKNAEQIVQTVYEQIYRSFAFQKNSDYIIFCSKTVWEKKLIYIFQALKNVNLFLNSYRSICKM